MAHLHLKNVADGQWRLAPQRDSQLSSGILQELGPKETPPPGERPQPPPPLSRRRSAAAACSAAARTAPTATDWPGGASPLNITPLAWCAGFFRRLGWRCRMLGRRMWAEVKLEWPLLKPRLWVIIPCLIFQYIHAIFTGMACEYAG